VPSSWDGPFEAERFLCEGVHSEGGKSLICTRISNHFKGRFVPIVRALYVANKTRAAARPRTNAFSCSSGREKLVSR
jgi:hypothetical protein